MAGAGADLGARADGAQRSDEVVKIACRRQLDEERPRPSRHVRDFIEPRTFVADACADPCLDGLDVRRSVLCVRERGDPPSVGGDVVTEQHAERPELIVPFLCGERGGQFVEARCRHDEAAQCPTFVADAKTGVPFHGGAHIEPRRRKQSRVVDGAGEEPVE